MATFTIDPYEGWTEAQLKERCLKLVCAVSKYQHIAMHLAVAAPDSLSSVPKEWADDVRSLIAAYSDDDHHTPRGGE